jgi:hypothetical protein
MPLPYEVLCLSIGYAAYSRTLSAENDRVRRIVRQWVSVHYAAYSTGITGSKFPQTPRDPPVGSLRNDDCGRRFRSNADGQFLRNQRTV